MRSTATGGVRDPLGRRALFVPPRRPEGEPLEGQRRPRGSTVPGADRGRRAVFSAGGHAPGLAGTRLERDAAGHAERTAASREPVTGTGGHADRRSQVDGGRHEPLQGHGSPGRGTRRAGTAGRTLGQVRIDCSTCGAWRVVGLRQFVSLHLPLFVVLPGRGFTRLLTCPACGRRSWVSVSWPASKPTVLDAAGGGAGTGEAGGPWSR